ncbi:MAG TPA: SDR family oxidoreductase [Caulifigura sp.]|nr:SDR family oxidoreductase [Caulifigura sp.]
MGYLLLTGATGLLGRYLMRDLLTAGVPLAVLVRRSRKKTPGARVEAAIRSWEELEGRTFERPVVLEGDITQPDFGLTPDQTKWAAENCNAMLHNAASLSFVSTGRHAEPWRSNVDGTKNALEFCRQADIHKFFQVSTAYVAGIREGRCYEHELRMGQEFANPYEESKVEAEELVRDCKHLDSVTVFRPAIIIGDSKSGVTFTYHNYYVMLELAHKLTEQLGSQDFTGRGIANYINLDAKSEWNKNLVPVDWVSAVMSHIITHPEHHGQCYHLTPRLPISVRLMRDVIEQVNNLYGINFGKPVKIENNQSLALELFQSHSEVYASYWRTDSIFDSTNTQRAASHLICPHVDRDMLVRLSEAAIENKFGWKDPAIDEPIKVLGA